MGQTLSSFEQKAAALEAAMRAAGYPVVRTGGKRTAEEQARLYAQGRTQPGKRVTGKSGAPGDESTHQLGTGLDFAFLGPDGQPSWDETHPWDVLGSKAKELGLEWGGDWTSVDRAHVQDPVAKRAAPRASVSTSETFRTPLGADRVQAPALGAPGSATRTAPPESTAPKRRYSAREIVEAWKAEFPGEFDRFDNSDVLKAILAEQPEFSSILDESSIGTESVPPPNLGGLEVGPDLSRRAKGPVAPPPSALRLPTYTDMAIEAGLVAVPSVMGGVIGSSVGPGGTAVGSVAGGAAGEFLREGYQNWSGTRDDGFSVPNIAVQGAINAIPFASAAGKGIKVLAPGLADVVAPSVARVAGNTLEGALASGTSTAAEALIRDERLPELSEVGVSAAFGAPFGAAIGVGGEVVGAVRAARAVPDPALVDMHFNDLRTSPNRNAAAQAIYDLATQVGQQNPAAGAALLQRLVGEAQALAQADLQTFAGQFVADFGKRADTLTMDGQISEVESFLSGLKERGAADQTITQVQQILTDIRTTSSPRPIDQPSTTGWYSPVEPLPLQQELGVQKSPLGMRDGPPLARVDATAPPTFAPQGVDALPAVTAGKVSREDALMIQWLADDLTENRHQASARMSGVFAQDEWDQRQANGGELERKTNWAPPVAGSPVQKMFKALGIDMTRPELVIQMENFLSGRARRPGKAALAAQKIATAMSEAWDPKARKFDWSLVSDERLAAVGLRSRRDFQSPQSPLWMFTQNRPQPDDLLRKFGAQEQPEMPPGPLGPEDWAPDQMNEARKLVRGASDDELKALHENLKLGGGVENLEEPDSFSGGWYDVGPGMIAAELERRGLGKYAQPSLMTEGPGTPGSLPLKAPELDEGTPVTTEAQPELLPEVRTTERAQPLLMDEAELFRLTPETVKPAKGKQAPLFGDDTGAVGAVRKLKEQRQAAIREVAISDADFADLKATVESAGGEEVAGLLVGDAQGNIRHVQLSPNRAANPTKQFEIDAEVIARTQHYARQRGWELLGSFHSQPTGSAEPSKQDLRGNVADLPMMILGVRGNSLRDVRVWQPSGSKSAPWLEGIVHLGAEKPKPGTPVPPTTASWMVDRIPTFKGAPGDAPAMADYLKTHKGEFATEPWYVRAQQYMDEGNARMAWIELQAATVATQKGVRDTVRASPLKDAHREALVARIEQATAAGPQDPVGALFALYDGRTTWVDGVGRVVVAPEIPPQLQGKGVTAGPGGILRPGVADIPLPAENQVINMTVDALNDVLKDADGHAILDDPTKASFTRLNTQIAEQLMLRSPSSWGATKAMRTAMKRQGLSDREINRQIAVHLTETASASGRFLAALSVWKKRNEGAIRSIEGIKGASGEIEDVLILGAGGRKIGRLSDLTANETYDAVVKPGRAWDRAMLLNDLTKKERGTFDTFEAASRAFMLSQWATAARNFWSVNARWGVEMFDEVAAAVASTTLAKPGRALKHLQKAGDLLRYTPILRPDGWVMPWHARQAQWEQVFNSTTYLASLPMGKERRAALKLLEGIPEEQAHFLGSANFGEPTPHLQSKYRILNAIASPKVQNTLTMFNRAQEFTARSGMYVANLRDELRVRGVDPDLLYSLPPADLAAKLGGEAELRNVLHSAVAGSLDFTFSGATQKGSWNAAIINHINEWSLVRSGYPWPKFNLSAAPRFIWDHSGVNAVVETINDVALRATSGHLGVHKGRFQLGKRAAALAGEHIPELQGKHTEAQIALGDSLQKVQALSREFTVRKRMVARLERRGMDAAANAERPGLETLEGALQREMEGYQRAEDRMKGLAAQIKKGQGTVDHAKEVRAPQSYAELWGRAGSGMAAMLMPAILLRADQKDKGTKWYQLRYDVPGMGDTVIDMRPFAPFTQYLFVADVINDLQAETDWAGVSEDLDGGMEIGEAMYGRYEGKYTSSALGAELLNAFISISQAAGTTLALVEQFTNIGERGLPSMGEVGNTAMTAIGSLLARFTIPFAQTKGLTDSFSPDESNARITSTDQGWAAPLAQPLANLPFIGAAVIPETYNQLSGKPLDAFRPDLRASLGVTLRQYDKVVGEINDTGVPGSSVYIRSTHDVFLDRLIAFNYATAVSQYADPLIFANEYYQSLDSPATKRDYLQAHVFPTLKKIALGMTMLDTGWERLTEAREGAEQRRRRLRTDRLLKLAGQEGISFEQDAGPESEPDAIELEPDAPDPSPESTAPTLEGRPQAGLGASRAPAFEDETGPGPAPPGALDRVLGPAFAG